MNLFFGLPTSMYLMHQLLLTLASIGFIGAFHEGLDNIPGMMGSHVRVPGKVSNFSSGMLQGVKGFGYGMWDGVTGLVTEPYEGAQKSGITGLVTGMARSCEF
jgi:hypothetical protein